MREEAPIAFITYTKGAVQFVTSPLYETHFLNWLNGQDRSTGYTREVHRTVGVKGAPYTVHATEKKEGTVLTMVKKDST